MLIPTKKLKSGFALPEIGLGTYGMGGRIDRDPFNDDVRDIRLIQQAIKEGLIHIDTAESYAQGYTEQLVGAAIKQFQREKLFLVSKVKKQHLNYGGIKLAVKRSLRRLGTDYLDLYLLHRYPSARLEECLTAMNELVAEGLIRNIGISNFNLAHTKDALRISAIPIVATQVHYNLQFREPDLTGLLEFCQQNDILLIAWRPINEARFNKTGIDLTKGSVYLLDQICLRYSKTPAQVAINWLTSQKNVVTIMKTSNSQHLKENLGAVGWRMSDADIDELRWQFPDQKPISDNQPLR